MNAPLRREVMARLVEFMAEAQRQGRDPVTAAKFAFPGTPETVLWGAWVDLDNREVDAWWETLEKTIEGDVITRALAGPAS